MSSVHGVPHARWGAVDTSRSIILAMISNQQKAHLGRHRRALTEGREDVEANMMARARGGYLARWRPLNFAAFVWRHLANNS